MLPDPVGIEPVISWSPVERTSNWTTEAGLTKARNVYTVFDFQNNQDDQ